MRLARGARVAAPETQRDTLHRSGRERTGAGVNAPVQNPNEDARTGAHVSPSTAPWTTLSGFESLPPSHFLALLVVAARQRVLWSCRGSTFGSPRQDRIPASQPNKSSQFNEFPGVTRARPAPFLAPRARVARRRRQRRQQHPSGLRLTAVQGNGRRPGSAAAETQLRQIETRLPRMWRPCGSRDLTAV